MSVLFIRLDAEVGKILEALANVRRAAALALRVWSAGSSSNQAPPTVRFMPTLPVAPTPAG